MANPIVLLGGAAAALLLAGGGKKKKKKTKSLAGQPCDIAAGAPSGYACDEDGLLFKVVDEGELEKDEEPSGDEVGDFETKEEDVSMGSDEDSASIPSITHQIAEDPEKMCEEFLQAIYVSPTDEGELPINSVAVEQTAMPAMKASMTGMAANLGGVDPESMGPPMVLAALTELIPVCQWKYDDTNDEFIYNDGRTIDSDIGKEVLFGLMNLSVQMMEAFIADNETPLPDPVPQPQQGLGFSPN